MPFLRNVWIAALTRTGTDAGTEGQAVLIMNKGDLDVIHQDVDLLREAADGGGSIFWEDFSESQIIPENYYLRVGIRGDDAWRPEVIAVWGERFTSRNIVPLGYCEGMTTWLSTDASEGRISMPVPQPVPGHIRTEITRVLLVTLTHFSDFETDDPVYVRIKRGDEVVLDSTIIDTPQDDFESGQANLNFLPALTPFTRSQLTDASIELGIKGRDAWRPISVMMFGLSEPSGPTAAVVPLVHIHPWELGKLSEDATEGAPSLVLPLAPIDP
jgi:hypothetical protein